ncbi:hypothetical protein KDA23_03110 [Candidatus Saccharibacteria bacterium]|nr:hypothetical protein [Candidatus Saccharibacteria bacterium]
MKKQQGFAVLETVLLLVIVAIIGLTGWYVWHSKQIADDSQNKALQASSGTIPATKVTSYEECIKLQGSKLLETYPEQCVTASGKKFTNLDQSVDDYLVVKEWGIRFKVPKGLSDVKYQLFDGKDSDEHLAVYAKPSSGSVDYRSDYLAVTTGSTPRPKYALGIVDRSGDKYKEDDGGNLTLAGKKVGDYYFYTSWAFSSRATGAGCTALYGGSTDKLCSSESVAFKLVNQGKDALLNTIELTP